MFYFHPDPWGRFAFFLTHIFELGGKKPPTSYFLGGGDYMYSVGKNQVQTAMLFQGPLLPGRSL